MNTADLDQIQFVTRHFNELQGLRLMMPAGLIALGLAFAVGFHNVPAQIFSVVVVVGAILLRVRLRSYYQTRFGEVESPAPGLEPILSLSPAGAATAVAGPRGFLNSGARRIGTFVGLAFIPFSILWMMSPAVVIDQPTDWSRLASQTVMVGGAPILKLDPSSLLMMMYFLCGSLFLGTWLWRGRRLSQSFYLVIGLLLLGLATLGASLGYVLQSLFDRGIARIAQVFVPPLSSLPITLVLCGAAFVLAGLLDHWQLVRALGRPAEKGQS
ncbi:MAG: hypothetical protein WAM82_04865 [Thermoanaerobaculia bacterium]